MGGAHQRRPREAEPLTTTRADHQPTPLDRAAPPARVIRARPGLPGSRSVVGGLLVALAAVGTWWVASGAGGDRAERYVVADRAIGPGEQLEAGDLRLATVDLPAGLRSNAFADPEAVVGAVTLGPIEPGELVQAGAVEATGDDGPGRQVSFSVDTDWAVAGDLRLGDRIDVYATAGDGDDATTDRVLASATVQRIAATGGDGLGESRSQTITVSVEDPGQATTLVNATRTATITVVRVTGTSEPGPAASTTTTTSGRGGG